MKLKINKREKGGGQPGDWFGMNRVKHFNALWNRFDLY